MLSTGLLSSGLAVGLLVLPPAGITLALAVDSTATTTTCGPGGAGDSGLALDAEQLANAQTIVATTAEASLPQRAAQIAVATALQESDLRNLDHGDVAGPTSRGLFQQKTQFYGVTVATDPVMATRAFLSRLVMVPKWQTIPLTVAAADVQLPRTDLRGAYARWESEAGQLTLRYWPGAPRGTGVPSTAVGCPGLGGDGRAEVGSTHVPTGFRVPTDGQAAMAVRYALAQLGKPYVWGGVGPSGYDCSGLTMQSWAAAGVAIPRTANEQSSFGLPITSTSELHPGDLVFIAGADGSAAHPGHVGMYIGEADGTPYLVQAPHTGTVVEITPLSGWHVLIVAMRRPLDSIG